MWQRISRVLRVENIPAPICAMFYKAVVMAVLLYGSESWNVPTAEMAALEGFHVAAARNLTGMRPRQLPNGTWHYPVSRHVLRAAHLHKVVEYVGVRRRGIMKKIADRPVLDLIRGAQRQRGSPPKQYWHELPMDMELDAAAFGDSVDRDSPGAEARAGGAGEEGARPPTRWGPRVRPVTPPPPDTASRWGPRLRPRPWREAPTNTTTAPPTRWGSRLRPRPQRAAPPARVLTRAEGIALLHGPYVPAIARAPLRAPLPRPDPRLRYMEAPDAAPTPVTPTAPAPATVTRRIHLPPTPLTHRAGVPAPAGEAPVAWQPLSPHTPPFVPAHISTRALPPFTPGEELVAMAQHPQVPPPEGWDDAAC